MVLVDMGGDQHLYLLMNSRGCSQYNHMLSGRNIQQSAPSVSGAPQGTDRGVCIFPGGNGVGIVSGLNRTMPIARPVFQGIGPPSMNSGSMIYSIAWR